MTDAGQLEAEIRRLIAIAGPMPVRQYMEMCLAHSEHGYYMTRDPLGSLGDFTTAPEISQMFGELVGLWAVAVWHQMGAPASIHLVELGPGRGTMMLDAVRAARVRPEFRQALRVHLVEISPALEQRQQRTLVGIDVPIVWHKHLADVPAGPTIVVANEFFDALPISQAVKKGNAWHERVVDIDDVGNFVFSVARAPLPQFANTIPTEIRVAPDDAIFEWRPNYAVFELAKRIVSEGGAALVIDYGHIESAAGDTFQAARAHGYADPLKTPGQVDLTAHVDFAAFALAAETMGARVHGPVEQAEFLRRMGIAERAEVLKAVLPPDKAASIDGAQARLVAGGRTGMGAMFKAIGLSDPKLENLPAFSD